jgi:hypothetical protein
LIFNRRRGFDYLNRYTLRYIINSVAKTWCTAWWRMQRRPSIVHPVYAPHFEASLSLGAWRSNNRTKDSRTEHRCWNFYTNLELSVPTPRNVSRDVKRGVSTIAVFTLSSWCKVIERRSGCVIDLFALILIRNVLLS